MKLINCYVSAFGNLKDFSIDFNQGLNTIKQDNGWGKSTLANFIKILFYGINDTKRNVTDNERTKYRPWNSTEKFGGYVEFLWGNKKFKIERYFGNKESEDTCKLFDLETGKEFKDTKNLGQRIFKIDEEGFLSTTYFSQKDFEAKSNSSITAKFNAVCDITNSDDFDKSMKKLEEKSKYFKSRGDKGVISLTKHQINEIEREIDSAENCTETVSKLRKESKEIQLQINEVKNEVDILNKKLQKASTDIAESERKKIYNELINKKEKIEQQINILDEKLKGNRTNREEISAYITCVEDFNKMKNDIQVIKMDVENLRSSKNENARKNKDFIYLIIGIISGLVLIGGIATLFFNLTAGIVLSVIGMLSFSVFLFMYFFIKNKFRSIKSATENIISSKLKSLHSFDDMYGQYWSKITTFLNKFGYYETDNIHNSLINILNDSDDITRLIEERDDIEKQLKNFNVSNDNFSDKTVINKTDFDLIKKAINDKINCLDELNKKLSAKLSSIKYYEDFSSESSELESKKSELLEKLKEYEEGYEVVNKTIKFLTKADENLKIKYKEPLQNSLNKYLSYIDDKNSVANIDIDLCVTVAEKDGYKVTDYYSKGYQNLFEICKRFALTDVLFKEEKPFIILDDPFYNLDDKKIESSLKLISELSNEYQIIYFVCHDSRRLS